MRESIGRIFWQIQAIIKKISRLNLLFVNNNETHNFWSRIQIRNWRIRCYRLCKRTLWAWVASSLLLGTVLYSFVTVPSHRDEPLRTQALKLCCGGFISFSLASWLTDWYTHSGTMEPPLHVKGFFGQWHSMVHRSSSLMDGSIIARLSLFVFWIPAATARIAMISCRTAAWILAFGRITTKYPYSTLQECHHHTLYDPIKWFPLNYWDTNHLLQTSRFGSNRGSIQLCESGGRCGSWFVDVWISQPRHGGRAFHLSCWFPEISYYTQSRHDGGTLRQPGSICIANRPWTLCSLKLFLPLPKQGLSSNSNLPTTMDNTIWSRFLLVCVHNVTCSSTKIFHVPPVTFFLHPSLEILLLSAERHTVVGTTSLFPS